MGNLTIPWYCFQVKIFHLREKLARLQQTNQKEKRKRDVRKIRIDLGSQKIVHIV